MGEIAVNMGGEPPEAADREQEGFQGNVTGKPQRCVFASPAVYLAPAKPRILVIFITLIIECRLIIGTIILIGLGTSVF